MSGFARVRWRVREMRTHDFSPFLSPPPPPPGRLKRATDGGRQREDSSRDRALEAGGSEGLGGLQRGVPRHGRQSCRREGSNTGDQRQTGYIALPRSLPSCVNRSSLLCHMIVDIHEVKQKVRAISHHNWRCHMQQCNWCD